MSDTLRAKKPKKFLKAVVVLLNVLIIAGLGFSTVFFYLKYQDSKNSNLTPEQRIAKYEKEISRSYTLPTGEKATLADVKSAADLKKDEANKEFFKDSADGDVLLVYSTSKLGILYRPSAKKIIKAGPVTFKDQTTTKNQAPAKEQALVTQIIGAKTDRDAAAAALNTGFSKDVTISSQVDAKTPLSAGSTVLVDVSGKNTELVKKMATELKGKVGNAPEGQDPLPSNVAIAIYAAPAATAPGL